MLPFWPSPRKHSLYWVKHKSLMPVSIFIIISIILSAADIFILSLVAAMTSHIFTHFVLLLSLLCCCCGLYRSALLAQVLLIISDWQVEKWWSGNYQNTASSGWSSSCPCSKTQGLVNIFIYISFVFAIQVHCHTRIHRGFSCKGLYINDVILF